MIDQQMLSLVKIHTDKNATYMLIKVVTWKRLKLYKDPIGMDVRW